MEQGDQLVLFGFSTDPGRLNPEGAFVRLNTWQATAKHNKGMKRPS